ncbi:uncharacterized protein VTP21DRAFT_732 [Calcarisporiella thermophila]|uniref:uncharacterized protein n=1 Tax=Calcarisporiella thermophila TaxID=911321 RepID=UPI0037440A50
MASRIDVHQHVIPPFYCDIMNDRNLDSGGWPIPPWDKESAIEMMNEQNIATGIVSVSAPGVHLGDDAEARKLVRQVNEYGAQLVKEHPSRFGHFASIPLPDVEGSVAEAIYALDVLSGDGVVLMSNAQGRYLGDPNFEPLWKVLDSRSAVVFIHPTESKLPKIQGIPAPIVDFPFDTTRTAFHMVLNGVMRKYTRMKVILSHAGGFLPYAAHRLAMSTLLLDPSRTVDDILSDMKRFYFDTAISASPTALPSLLAFAKPGHVLYGSDWPFVPTAPGAYFNNNLDTSGEWVNSHTLESVNISNAKVLFPRLADYMENKSKL